MNRRNRNRAVAAAWTEFRASEEAARLQFAEHRATSIAAGKPWTPQGRQDSAAPPVWSPKDPTLGPSMLQDIRRGRKREKKVHNVAVSD